MEIDHEIILNLYPGYDSVLGPYLRKDGRKHIVLNNTEAPKGQKDKTKTISYPKALYETILNRRLKDNETIDHNDRDKSNDNLNNLILRDRSIHSSLDALKVKTEDVYCVECGKVFTPTIAQRNKQSSGIDGEPAGPFCSRRCTGIYGSKVQNTGEKIERQPIIKIYYREEK